MQARREPAGHFSSEMEFVILKPYIKLYIKAQFFGGDGMARYAARTGRIKKSNGKNVNLVDLLGGTDTGERADIERYLPMGGDYIGEDVHIYNIGDAIQKLIDGGGTGGGGGSVELQPLTITLGDTVYTYDGKTTVNITLEPAEGVSV